MQQRSACNKEAHLVIEAKTSITCQKNQRLTCPHSMHGAVHSIQRSIWNNERIFFPARIECGQVVRGVDGWEVTRTGEVHRQ